MNKLAFGSGWWPAGNPTGTYDSAQPTYFAGYYGNTYAIQGGRDNSLVPPQARIMRPEEMWNVDTKMDDGQPHLGAYKARKGFGCTLNDTTAPEYALSVNDVVCNGSYNLK